MPASKAGRHLSKLIGAWVIAITDRKELFSKLLFVGLERKAKII